MLSQKTRYAIRALAMLAEHGSEEPVQIADIAADRRVPKKFLELILLDLKRHGLVHSFRGKHGGYALARSPGAITFGEVIRIVDGPLAQVPCVSKTAYRRCEDCIDEKTCVIRRVLGRVRDSTAAILDGTTLADVMAPAHPDFSYGSGI